MPDLSRLSNPTPRLSDPWYHPTSHSIRPSESLKNERMVYNHERQKHTSSAISMTCHSSDSRRRSEKRGMIRQSLSKTWRPLLALCLRGRCISPEMIETRTTRMYSKVSDSSATTSVEAKRSTPWLSNTCTLHMACTVLR
jgi:hypothetical protein